MCVVDPSLASASCLSALQLGNYLGALSHWVELQKTAVPGDRLFFSVVDLHALTVQRKKDAPSVRDDAETMTAALLAIGLDPSRCTIFCQSHVGNIRRSRTDCR